MTKENTCSTKRLSDSKSERSTTSIGAGYGLRRSNTYLEPRTTEPLGKKSLSIGGNLHGLKFRAYTRLTSDQPTVQVNLTRKCQASASARNQKATAELVGPASECTWQ